MIPKVIHYCWFGENPLPELAQKCIASWKKYFPEYKILEWNESNFELDCCAYIKEAYEAKKWAFVSDYVRFKVLYDCGGVYFDTDVEVINDMSDIIEQGSFMGCEMADYSSNAMKFCVNPGLGLGCEPGLKIYKEILDSYQGTHFINIDGSYNFKTVVERTTDILKKYGLADENVVQCIAGITIYPKQYFCPMDYGTGELHITNETKSIHWYDASWLDERMKKRKYRSNKIRKLFKGKLGFRLSKVYMSVSYYWEWISTGQFEIIMCKLLAKFKG